MVSGVNAGKHGIWDFSERDASGYGLRLVNGSHSRAPALWTRLSHRRVGIVNVPFTWPAPSVNGFALAGIDAAAREDGMTSPRELVHELQERFGRLLLDHSFPVDAEGRLDLELVRRACEQKVAIVDWLAERYDPELLFVVFMAADHVHHLAWPDWEERGRELERGRGLPDPRRLARRAAQARERRDERAGRLRPRRRLAARRRQPERLARRARATCPTARTATRTAAGRTGSSSCGASCRRNGATRSSSGCRGCASAPTGCRRRASSTGATRAPSPTGSSGTSS